jgi:hypothetical protein
MSCFQKYHRSRSDRCLKERISQNARLSSLVVPSQFVHSYEVITIGQSKAAKERIEQCVEYLWTHEKPFASIIRN